MWIRWTEECWLDAVEWDVGRVTKEKHVLPSDCPRRRQTLGRPVWWQRPGKTASRNCLCEQNPNGQKEANRETHCRTHVLPDCVRFWRKAVPCVLGMPAHVLNCLLSDVQRIFPSSPAARVTMVIIVGWYIELNRVESGMRSIRKLNMFSGISKAQRKSCGNWKAYNEWWEVKHHVRQSTHCVDRQDKAQFSSPYGFHLCCQDILPRQHFHILQYCTTAEKNCDDFSGMISETSDKSAHHHPFEDLMENLESFTPHFQLARLQLTGNIGKGDSHILQSRQSRKDKPQRFCGFQLCVRVPGKFWLEVQQRFQQTRTRLEELRRWSKLRSNEISNWAARFHKRRPQGCPADSPCSQAHPANLALAVSAGTWFPTRFSLSCLCWKASGSVDTQAKQAVGSRWTVSWSRSVSVFRSCARRVRVPFCKWDQWQWISTLSQHQLLLEIQRDTNTTWRTPRWPAKDPKPHPPIRTGPVCLTHTVWKAWKKNIDKPFLQWMAFFGINAPTKKSWCACKNGTSPQKNWLEKNKDRIKQSAKDACHKIPFHHTPQTSAARWLGQFFTRFHSGNERTVMETPEWCWFRSTFNNEKRNICLTQSSEWDYS